jgi:hypothetical protein
VTLSPFNASIMLRTAKEVTGEWTLDKLWDLPPPWNNTTRFSCYAAKAHPEMAAQEEEMVITFNCNDPIGGSSDTVGWRNRVGVLRRCGSTAFVCSTKPLVCSFSGYREYRL